MSKYLIVMRGPEGCDYTIGCGVDVRHVEADSRGEALRKIDLGVFGAPGDCSPSYIEERIKQVQVYEISDEVPYDFTFTLKQKKDQEQAEIDAQARDKKRAEYERLKKEFEP